MLAADPRLEPALDRAFRWVDRALRADQGQPPGFTALLCERLEAMRGGAQADPRQFLAVAGPVALAGSDTPLAAAACTALHLAGSLEPFRFEVMGRAGVPAGPAQRDGTAGTEAGPTLDFVSPRVELGLDRSGGVDPAVLAAAGQVLLSVALAFLGDLDDPAPAMRTAAFAARRLAGGRALAQEALSTGRALDSALALELARLETGCSYACCAQIAAIAGGLPGETWTGLWRWGEAVGAARQLESLAAAPAAADPVATEERALVGVLANQLRDEARQVLAGTWLPWGARPILEGAGISSWRPAHQSA